MTSSYCPPHLKETIRAPQQFIPSHTNNAFLLPRRYCWFGGVYHVCQCPRCMSRTTPELCNIIRLLFRKWLDPDLQGNC
ncbi:hypothetical protein BDR03DRAFT_968419, partial [Suillus americanus]